MAEHNGGLSIPGCRCKFCLCSRCGMVGPDHMPGDENCRPACARPHVPDLTAPESAHVVEKVARALHDSNYPDGLLPWDDLPVGPDLGAAYYRRLALAAVVALDEVTR